MKRTIRLEIRLSTQERRMLDVLSVQKGLTDADTIRQLLRHAHGEIQRVLEAAKCDAASCREKP